jgi:hypothetical protein
MKLDEFAKKHIGKPVTFRMSEKVTFKPPEPYQQGHPDVTMSVIQKVCIDSLINKGMPYDNVCHSTLGYLAPLEALTAEEAMLIIERGNYLTKKRQDDRHRHTFGSNPKASKRVRRPMHVLDGQVRQIQSLVHAGVAYHTMLREALGETKDINRLTFKEAVAVISAGTEMKDRPRWVHEAS